MTSCSMHPEFVSSCPLTNGLHVDACFVLQVSCFAAEVANPTRTYPRALFLSVVLISLCYLVPLAAASGANQPSWKTWTDGSFADIASAVGGPWLLWMVLFGTLFGAAALFLAEVRGRSLGLGLIWFGFWARPLFKRTSSSRSVA